MKNVVIVDGLRTPFVKAWNKFWDIEVPDLLRPCFRELLGRTHLSRDVIDEVIVACAGEPVDTKNIARVVAIESGLPHQIPAYTVNRNCASGIQAVVNAYQAVALGDANVVLVGGVESMSNFPFMFRKSTQKKFMALQGAKKTSERLKALRSFRPRDFSPEIALELGLTDRTCKLNMGQNAEVLVGDFKISREAQEEFALLSHQRAVAAIENGRLREELILMFLPPRFEEFVDRDIGPRENQTPEQLAKLKLVFEREFGTITAGTSSQITDGAVALLVMEEGRARALGYTPLVYIRGHAAVGCEPKRMGLGPAFATAKIFEKTGVSLKDIDLMELNEAFAAVVLANEIAFASKEFAQKQLGRRDALGEINREILNVNGGAIALGHPIAATGGRLILTLAKEMNLRNSQFGLATLCVGGGQGAAILLERR